jgi:hypothetical protein
MRNVIPRIEEMRNLKYNDHCIRFLPLVEMTNDQLFKIRHEISP